MSAPPSSIWGANRWRSLGGVVQHAPGSLRGEPPAAGVEEHGGAGSPARGAAGGYSLGETGPGPDQVRLEGPRGVAAHRDHPVLATLADPAHHRIIVQLQFV